MVGKYWKNCKTAKIRCSESIWTTSLGKYYKSCKISCSKSIWTILVGKYWENCKTAKIDHSKSIQNTAVGTYWKSCKMAKIGHSESILHYFGRKILEKLQNSMLIRSLDWCTWHRFLVPGYPGNVFTC